MDFQDQLKTMKLGKGWWARMLRLRVFSILIVHYKLLRRDFLRGVRQVVELTITLIQLKKGLKHTPSKPRHFWPIIKKTLVRCITSMESRQRKRSPERLRISLCNRNCYDLSLYIFIINICSKYIIFLPYLTINYFILLFSVNCEVRSLQVRSCNF